jgi:hypothetical protein
MFTIGYIDEDKGWQQTFYDYFKDEFKVINIEVRRTSTVESLVDAIYKNEIELVVVDFRLNETGEVPFNGDAVIDRIINRKPHFPIIVLTSFEPDAISTLENVNIINGKDILDGENQEKVELLKKRINANINNYYQKIDKARKTVDELQEKLNKGPLEIDEEEILAKQYIFLDEVFPDEKIIPDNIKISGITQLNTLLDNTKSILAELKKLTK